MVEKGQVTFNKSSGPHSLMSRNRRSCVNSPQGSCLVLNYLDLVAWIAGPSLCLVLAQLCHRMPFPSLGS